MGEIRLMSKENPYITPDDKNVIVMDNGIVFYNETFKIVSERGEQYPNGFFYEGGVTQEERQALLDGLDGRENIVIDYSDRGGAFFIAWDESGYEFDLTLYEDSVWYMCRQKANR